MLIEFWLNNKDEKHLNIEYLCDMCGDTTPGTISKIASLSGKVKYDHVIDKICPHCHNVRKIRLGGKIE